MCYNDFINHLCRGVNACERRYTMNKKIMAAISMILVFSFLFAFAGCSSTEEEETTTTTIKVKTILPTDITTSYDEESQLVTDTTYSPEALAANTVTIFEKFNLWINETKGATASAEMSQSKSISKAKDAEGNDIPMSDNDYLNAAITSLDSYMLHNDGASIEYGESLKDFLPVKGTEYVSAITLDEVERATCVDNGDQRIITVTLKNTDNLPETLKKAFDMGSVEDVLAEFEKAEKYLTVGNPTLTYKDCQIIITSNLTTDEVHTIEYVKNVDVAVDVTGEGSLADMGTVPVTFRYSNNIKYTIDRTVPETEAAE